MWVRRTYYLSYGWTLNKDYSLFVGEIKTVRGVKVVRAGPYTVGYAKARKGALDNVTSWHEDDQKRIKWFRENHNDFTKTAVFHGHAALGVDIYNGREQLEQMGRDAYVDIYIRGPLITTGVVLVGSLTVRTDIVLSGGRSGQNVKNLKGPPNSVLKGSGQRQRIFVTNDKGEVIFDITRTRTKPVVPGQGFGRERAPTADELKLIDQLHGTP